jgi:hypothetical protein
MPRSSLAGDVWENVYEGSEMRRNIVYLLRVAKKLGREAFHIDELLPATLLDRSSTQFYLESAADYGLLLRVPARKSVAPKGGMEVVYAGDDTLYKLSKRGLEVAAHKD